MLIPGLAGPQMIEYVLTLSGAVERKRLGTADHVDSQGEFGAPRSSFVAGFVAISTVAAPFKHQFGLYSYGGSIAPERKRE